MKKLTLIFLSIVMTLSVVACSKEDESIKPIYHTPEEWSARFTLTEYGENKVLDSIPSGRPSALCVNGTFVGNTVEGVNVFRGIPYAEAPIGELRFKKAQPVLPSDEIFDATYFGKSFMQPVANGELASQYEIGEDCLRLNVWNNSKDTSASKPVMVYIHGGGFVTGGTSDPLYDGWNFVHYNPDVILVTISYRGGMLGFMNMSELEGGEDYKYATNNAFYDQIEALRWIKSNIAGFGGDPENITICGESAGGCAVSSLCVMKEAKGLFQKAIAMSGAVNLCVTPDRTTALTAAVKEGLNVKSVEDLQKIPFDELQRWWNDNMLSIYNNPCRDGVTLDEDLFGLYRDGFTKDLTILQGHTKDEFRYYYTVFNNCLPAYQEICDQMVDAYEAKSGPNFAKLYDNYKKAVLALGYPEENVTRCFADDMSLAISNTYQALLHANAGGKGYSYTFSIPYDEKFDDFELGAAHAVDTSYLFGNFDGVVAMGSNESVDASIRFQRMIANFCKNGDPSTDEINWPVYESEHRNKLIIELSGSKVVENPEKERVDAALAIIEQLDNPYSMGLAPILAKIYEESPDVVAAYAKTRE